MREKQIDNSSAIRMTIMVLLISITFMSVQSVSSQTSSATIIYLARDERNIVNLWMVDLSAPGQPAQLTSYDEPETLIFNEQVTIDGRLVAYRVHHAQGALNREIMLLDLLTHRIEPITTCAEVDANCDTFSIRPDGHYVAYYQASLDQLLVRVIDLTTSPYIDYVVHEFNSEKDRWHHALLNWTSPTGYLTFNLPGPEYNFQVYDVEQRNAVHTLPLGNSKYIPFFSPDERRYAHYEPANGVESAVIVIRATDSPTEPISKYSEADSGSDVWLAGGIMDWYPDNEHLLISTMWFREPTEPNMGWLQSDLAIFNTTTGVIEQLTNDMDYNVFNASLSADASLILYQRQHRKTAAECYCDQFMLYDMNSGEIRGLDIWGATPHWVFQ